MRKRRHENDIIKNVEMEKKEGKDEEEEEREKQEDYKGFWDENERTDSEKKKEENGQGRVYI